MTFATLSAHDTLGLIFSIVASYPANSKEQSDVLQGLMTGIGFVGAGTIMKESDETHGVATAAAISRADDDEPVRRRDHRHVGRRRRQRDGEGMTAPCR
jgi:hypothetical protein